MSENIVETVGPGTGALIESAKEGGRGTVTLVEAKAQAFMGVCSRALSRIREFRLELSPRARQKVLTFCLVSVVGLCFVAGVLQIPSGGGNEVQAQFGTATPIPTSTLMPIPPTPMPGVCGNSVVEDDEECDPPGSVNPLNPNVKCMPSCLWGDNFVYLPFAARNYR